MIITNLHLFRAVVNPNETDTPLVVDTDRVLALALPRKHLQAIAWRNRDITKLFRCVKLKELSKSDPSDVSVPS